MTNDLPRTPEGQLIRRARERAIPKLTIRAAAARIGMSAEQWGYAERGYLPRRGETPEREFRPPADTLARMARGLGSITPAQLADDGERPDAAESLRQMLRPGPGLPPLPPEPPTSAEEAEIMFPGDRTLQLIWQLDEPRPHRLALVRVMREQRERTARMLEGNDDGKGRSAAG